MRILSMTATFGKLEGRTLTPEPGLNVIQAPNEWGKSTWCAFLSAMLYGVETRERNTKGQMADKERYAPWSGKPMEGTLRVEWQGRDITIQRRTRGRIPLGEFQAFETDSGLEVPELTGENCGQMLLGVEKSVFRRTGFIRFTDLAVLPDEVLWQRLHGLVTSGDESGSAAVLHKKLKELKNKCRTNRGGLIPEAERKLQDLQGQHREREALENRCLELETEAKAIQSELQTLQRHKRVLNSRASRENRDQISAARMAAENARAAAAAQARDCMNLEPQAVLSERLEQAERKLQALASTENKSRISGLWIILPGLFAVLALIAAGYFLIRKEPVLMAGFALVSVLLAIVCAGVSGHRKREALIFQAEQTKAKERIRRLEYEAERLRRNITLWESLKEARRLAEQAELQLQYLEAAAQEDADTEADDDLTLTAEETMARMEELTLQLRENRMRVGQCQGKMEMLPNQTTLMTGIEACRERLLALQGYERALELGIQTQEAASRELQRRFAPRITALARDYLGRITMGRYDRVTIGTDLTMLAANESETTLRSGAWRSDGTADAMYLALRLAVWVLLNPEGPLVLDDALIRLDDRRLECVLELLRELGAGRQILLFSCQDRERRWAERNR